MSGVVVKVEINNDGFIPLCKSPEVQAQLEQAAQKIAAQARATAGKPSRNRTFRNDDFIVVSKQLSRTAIARVSAANPRSDWYAKNRNAFKQ